MIVLKQVRRKLHVINTFEIQDTQGAIPREFCAKCSPVPHSRLLSSLAQTDWIAFPAIPSILKKTK